MRTLRRVGLHLAVSIVITWPLVLHLTGSIPLGIETSGTVPFFNLWTWRWNQQQVGDLYRAYWDAPIFHPTPGAFAFSDPQPLTGLVFAPVSWLTHDPTLAYNLVVLAIFTANGWGAARLARRLGVGEWPAVIAGVFAQALPFAINELGVVQLTVLFPVFLLLDAVVAWAGDDERWPGPAIGVWLAVTFLTSSYYGLFAVVVVPVASLAFVSRSLLTKRRLVGLAAGVVIFAVTALPVALTQKHYTDPYPRPEQLVDELSAQPVDYVHLDPDKTGIGLVPFLRAGGGSGHALYPGTALLVLAIAGVVVALRRPAAAGTAGRDEGGDPAGPAEADEQPSAVPAARRAGNQREPVAETRGDQREPVVGSPSGVAAPIALRTVVFLVAGAAVSFALSFGTHLGVGPLNLFDVLRDHLPGYAGLRSPFRFAVLVQVFLVPLAAVALDRLWRHPEEGGRVIAIGLAVLALLEVGLPPQALVEVPDPKVEWAGYLASRPGSDAAAVVPFPAELDASAYEPTTRWMLSALGQPHPLANGYSGLFPPEYDQLEADMKQFPDRRSLDELRRHGVRWVVVQHDWLTEARRREITATGRLREASRGEDSTVFELT